MTPDDDDDDGPLTPEEIAARDQVPTVGGDIFSRVIDVNGVLGDSLLDSLTSETFAAPGE